MEKVMNCSTRILAALTLLGTIVVAQAASPLEPCRFKDDKKAAISLTFDGASRKQYDFALPLLEKYNFKGTFYIPVNAIPNSPDDGVKAQNSPGWEDLKNIAAKGHELGNASMNYYPVNQQPEAKLPELINAPIAIIKEKTGVEVETFGLPAGGGTDAIRKMILEKHLGVSLWRIGFGSVKDSAKAEDIFESRFARRDDVALLINCNDASEFETFLKKLKSYEDQIWVDTYASVCKYIILRDQGNLSIKSENAGMITAELKSPRKETGKTELTIRYNSPAAINVIQNGKPVKVVNENGSSRFNILPGEFTINVSK